MSQSLTEFIENELERIALFKQYWEENHILSPEVFPLELPSDNSGLWFELYSEFNAEDYQKKFSSCNDADDSISPTYVMKL